MKKGDKKELIIEVKTFGEFSLSVEGKVILCDEGKSRKLWNLLAFLIAQRKRGLLPSELPELLCKDDSIDEPTKVVKNLAYRLRRMLKESQLPDENYIIQSGGTYRWNPDIELSTDADRLLTKWEAANICNFTRRSEDALEKYMEAIESYNGRFLPGLIYEEWTEPQAVYYQRIFKDCIIRACNLMYGAENYEGIIPICQKAIKFDPYDEEIYKIYIENLIWIGRQKEALIAYETITNRLYSEIGVSPSKDLRGLYRNIIKSIKNVEMELQTIKGDLNEDGAVHGTYCCEYEIFKEIYRFVARGVERLGEPIFILLCTVTNRQDEIPETESMGMAMESLEEGISKVLRKGDLFAKYSCTQYVIMLPYATCENSGIISERISKEYKKYEVSKHTKLHFKIQPLDPKVD